MVVIKRNSASKFIYVTFITMKIMLLHCFLTEWLKKVKEYSFSHALLSCSHKVALVCVLCASFFYLSEFGCYYYCRNCVFNMKYYLKPKKNFGGKKYSSVFHVLEDSCPFVMFLCSVITSAFCNLGFFLRMLVRHARMLNKVQNCLKVRFHDFFVKIWMTLVSPAKG